MENIKAGTQSTKSVGCVPVFVDTKEYFFRCLLDNARVKTIRVFVSCSSELHAVRFHASVMAATLPESVVPAL